MEYLGVNENEEGEMMKGNVEWSLKLFKWGFFLLWMILTFVVETSNKPKVYDSIFNCI